ncbi:copper chaperone [Virgibacillus natechei]|uniref:Copper chaperone CopZ n=1 Tax=Virgibacillus natechei TaxID=1216297 RepID=A0ABS4IG65_9BACI|nr:copper chaperone CopZ [Virgibacillus natechei]MBP1969927.1 copper chaperone [Virgibacillus natechei]UZD13408.1 copper chaperone CopZ [Virgibacillus natechei]
MQTTIDVQGMTCGHCKSSVEGSLKELNGITAVEVDLSTGKVAVTYEEEKVTVEDMREAIEEQGYDIA